ncbi:hypothetical protein H257_12746 [Aphanomyces astaci]|uniref:Uncharacterized protein n=1 Tax=Aphanomyces astaci TaxID=112090 RepID=W4FXQ5_APHAT|nr:hypothetical protein H257_12746 [Aphanomyces astaci]ETV72285.1 hypothetical protein H257_12746 [Aphanomyces astaci]|eukprot:XP_009838353.1 hypothetical protein H257_12746 [Aphanomyces astaci]
MTYSHPDVAPTSEYHSLPRDVWWQRTMQDKTGSLLLAPTESTSPPQKLSHQLVDTMEAWVEFDCQITLAELKARIQVDYDIVISETSLHPQR